MKKTSSTGRKKTAAKAAAKASPKTGAAKKTKAAKKTTAAKKTAAVKKTTAAKKPASAKKPVAAKARAIAKKAEAREKAAPLKPAAPKKPKKSGSKALPEPLSLAEEMAHWASDKKATEILVLDLRGLASYTDYFVICSGQSTQQVGAIADYLEQEARKKGIRPVGIEGRGNARWVLLDYSDVLVHVFEEETRRFYELEKLWLDAPRLRLQLDGKPAHQAPVGRKD